MDLEELNKTQIILLTLLVSFVSAIATSIFTVKILEKAPPAVTQTINRVVERTVERVVPAEPTDTEDAPTVIEKETTVVVKEDDLITESIEKNKRRIVRLVTVEEGEGEPVGTSTEPTITRDTTFHGIGVIVSTEGILVTDSAVSAIEGMTAIDHLGREFSVEALEGSGPLGYLQLVAQSEEDTLPSFAAATFVDESTLKLGQTVIVLGGEERTSVSTGIIASLVEGDADQGLESVRTNVSGSIPGSPLVNIFGEVVGIDVLQTPGVFAPGSDIQAGLTALTPASEEETSEETTQVTPPEGTQES